MLNVKMYMVNSVIELYFCNSIYTVLYLIVFFILYYYLDVFFVIFDSLFFWSIRFLYMCNFEKRPPILVFVKITKFLLHRFLKIKLNVNSRYFANYV